MKDNQLVSCTISIEAAYLIILIILAVMGWENVFSPARLFHYQFAWQILELPDIKINLHSLLTFTYTYTLNINTQHSTSTKWAVGCKVDECFENINIVSLMLLIVCNVLWSYIDYPAERYQSLFKNFRGWRLLGRFFGIENQYLRNYKPSGTCP